MKHFIIGLIVLVSPFFAWAHNPLSAKYHFEAGEHASLLSINLSQDGVNKVLIDQYGLDAVNQMTATKLKELLVAYIKDNFHFLVNHKKLRLDQGGIKLGSHQTDLKFVLPAFPQKVQDLSIHIPAFQENANHQTIFSYVIHGKADKVILTPENDYQSAIFINEVMERPNFSWIIGGVLGLIFVAFFFFKK